MLNTIRLIYYRFLFFSFRLRSPPEKNEEIDWNLQTKLFSKVPRLLESRFCNLLYGPNNRFVV